EEFLEVSLLRGAEFVIEDDRVGIGCTNQVGQFTGFAASEIQGGVGFRASLCDTPDDISAGGVDEQCEFVEVTIGLFSIITVEGDADDHDALTEAPVDESVADPTVITECTAV